ncbi:NnrU family protein [Acidomonas methanolica]|uniref:NnrU domain-containing protein n=1 Tax=Acidomonas methanolica NBRC 104435 TaxID=1231351 RepID=A0A023D8I7_ACIMT|nr:NnrU family protein [Acidomonas methanolica]MBU2653797.1 NnrU family protein [Acidomonas methanolica]TCS31751.1 putative membrane protein [Acidomonas methanolica]GAJ30482.1 hypothetical protein Amme_139_019 [Acidomonas methanolica NBRC 104435]GBQ51474.1 putative membrane protein [Acidomonas methanolica]GEL00454.1 NnrU protein [Acidomonas methanolica NBRC 104435]
MRDGSVLLLVAAIAFVATHLALSHPLRRMLVGWMGEAAFAGLYSTIAAITLGTMIWTFMRAPTTPPVWPVGNGLWAMATVMMLGASILLMGSLIRNPALPGAGGSAATMQAHGVFAITRHPMMWSFALWGTSHILILPITRNIILSGAIVFLSLVGSFLQDRKKTRLDPAGWAAWKSRTSYLPFAAIVQGKARFGQFGAYSLLGGLVLWIVASWAHIPLSGIPAGIWRWLT